MKTLALILALTLAACADLPEDQATPDTEQDAPELGSIEQAAVTSHPYQIRTSLESPDPWYNSDTNTVFTRTSSATANPTVYQGTSGEWGLRRSVSSAACTLNAGTFNFTCQGLGVTYGLSCPTWLLSEEVVQKKSTSWVSPWANVAPGTYAFSSQSLANPFFARAYTGGVECRYKPSTTHAIRLINQ